MLLYINRGGHVSPQNFLNYVEEQTIVEGWRNLLNIVVLISIVGFPKLDERLLAQIHSLSSTRNDTCKEIISAEGCTRALALHASFQPFSDLVFILKRQCFRSTSNFLFLSVHATRNVGCRRKEYILVVFSVLFLALVIEVHYDFSQYCCSKNIAFKT